MKLYLVTHKSGGQVYFPAKTMKDCAEFYSDCKTIEWISDRFIMNQGERYDLLEEAYNFISAGGSTFSNEQRVELQDKIKLHLKISEPTCLCGTNDKDKLRCPKHGKD